MPEKDLTSFVVIAYNEADNISKTVAAITALDELGEHEVIVVDDGSRDETADIVRKIANSSKAVRLIELGTNHGRGFSRYRGITEARGEFIATIDADIILPPDWLVRARAAIENRDAVGGTPVPDGDVTYLYRKFRLTPRCVGNTTIVTGNNGLYRHEVFKLVSFDGRLREGEDVALNYAMNQKGLSIATVPGLLVRHLENKSFGRSLRWLFESGMGATRQLVVYRTIRQPDLATGGFVMTTVLCMLAMVHGKYRVIGAVLPVGFIMAASAQHVRSRFEMPIKDWHRLAPAIIADSALLAAYFAGRIAGLSLLPRHWPRQRVNFSNES